jgi:putative ABC transport system permease protein
MAGEIALSLVLLIGAGLMLKSFVLLRGVNLGFAPERVLSMNITLPERGGEAPSTAALHHDHDGPSTPKPGVDPEAIRRLNFFENLTKRVDAIPGVESAAFGRFPLRGHWTSSYLREDHPADHDYVMLDSQMSSADYFRTLQLQIVAGRAFTDEDREGTEPVVIVNQAFARKYYPGMNVLNRRIRRTGADSWRKIVGVVADAHFHGQDKDVDPAAFLPAAQVDSYPMAISDFAVKSALPLDSLLPAIRKSVWSLDPNQPLTRIRTLSESVSESRATRRFQMMLLMLFGLLALALAIVGIYGVVAYSVGQRSGEIGIRMALGARQATILGMVMRHAMTLAAFGVAVGLAAAWGASRSLATLLYGVKPIDFGTYAAVSVLLAAATMAAAWLPARRASQTDPIVTLRHE